MLHDQDISRKCPCGSNQPFSVCCEPAIEGVKAARTAEALMRSRYTAFSLGAVDYLIETTAAEKRRPDDAALLAEQVQSTLWVGLEVLKTERGSADDDWGMVEFVAHFETGDQQGELRERSNFRQQDGRWYYVDGEVEVRL